MENEQQAERNYTLFLSDEGNLIAYNKFSTQKSLRSLVFFFPSIILISSHVSKEICGCLQFCSLIFSLEGWPIKATIASFPSPIYNQ